MKQRICQSCGMSMPTDDLLGTHGNGCLCTEYCYHCFQKGFFTNSSLEEQIELNIQPESLNAFNKASGCLLYTSPSPRDISGTRMPSSA